MTLEGKTALISGGSSGIGFATAQILLQNGARVAIVGQDVGRLEHARTSLGEGVIAVRADVRSRSDLRRMREEIAGAFGSLDIFFANAGVAFATPIATTDEVMYDTLMDINVKGVFFSVQSVLPIMHPGGSIILNTAWLNQVGIAERSLISASKAAVRSYARTLSAELLGRQIRVNAVSPGSIMTSIHRREGQSEEEFQAYVGRVGSTVPVGRMGKPQDIAAAVLFLASDSSSYILGAEIVVDGGRSEL